MWGHKVCPVLLFSSFHHVRTQHSFSWKDAAAKCHLGSRKCRPHKHWNCWHFGRGLSASRTVRERFLLFIDWLPDILLQQQKTDWDIRILDKVIYAFFFVTISYNYGNFLLVLVFVVFELCVGTLFYARLCFNCIFSYFSGKFLPHFP